MADQSFQQQLLITHPAETAFLPDASGHRPQFLYRELNVDQATGGAYNAHVIRGSGNKTPIAEHLHTELDFLFVYVITGEVTFEYEGHGAHTLAAGSCHMIPPGMPHSVLAWSDDLEMIEITSPGQYKTTETADVERQMAVA